MQTNSSTSRLNLIRVNKKNKKRRESVERDLQLMSSLTVSSMADEGMWVFSARQVTSLPMSSMLAVNDSRLMVVLPSGDFCSSACFSLVTPIHQVMAAGGWEPEEMQLMVDTFSADNGFFSLTIFTDNGRTREKWKKLVKNLLSTQIEIGDFISFFPSHSTPTTKLACECG